VRSRRRRAGRGALLSLLVTVRRSPNLEERRRLLCDTAIELLADEGMKGVTHLRIDRRAGVADGTTSFYFRTRAALLQAVANRIADLDLADLTAAIGETHPPGTASGLSRMLIRHGIGDRLRRTKARNEMALAASRDPDLAAAFTTYTGEFDTLIRDAVRRFQPAGAVVDDLLMDDQAHAVRMFIGGFMVSLAGDDRRIHTAEELDAFLSSIVAGFAARRAVG
jgi:AcrR family transcriptional regulator